MTEPNPANGRSCELSFHCAEQLICFWVIYPQDLAVSAADRAVLTADHSGDPDVFRGVPMAALPVAAEVYRAALTADHSGDSDVYRGVPTGGVYLGDTSAHTFCHL